MSRLRGDTDGSGEPAATRTFGGRASLLVACLGIGLLLWARLVIVSDMPRMALAEPEEPAVGTTVDAAASGPSRAADPPPGVRRDDRRDDTDGRD